jgi:hypothetical protein
MLQTGLIFNESHQVKGERVINDYYPTPQPITKILLKNVPHLPELCFEPCSGQRAICDVLEGNNFMTYESDPVWGMDCLSDATTREFWDEWKIRLGQARHYDRCNWATVTNPPFNLASKILPLAFEYSPWGVAFLLRLSYLEPAGDRASWLQEHADNMRYLIPVNPRPHFRKNTKGTDSSTVFWGVWQRSWSWRLLGIKCPFIFENGWKS